MSRTPGLFAEAGKPSVIARMAEAGNDRQDIIWLDEETRYANSIRLQQQQQQQHQQNQLHQQQMQGHHAAQQPGSGAPVMVGSSSLYMGPEQYGMSMHHQGPHAVDNYTVLPMGHGNFLKVYHNQDESMNFNNYELFSSNTFIPAPQQPPQHHQASVGQPHLNKPAADHHHAHHTHQHVPSSQDAFFHANLLQSQYQSERGNGGGLSNDDNTNNLFLNQLVENWVPNMSGTYSPFGEPPQSMHTQQQQALPSREPLSKGFTNDTFGFVPAPAHTMFAQPLPTAPLLSRPVPDDSATVIASLVAATPVMAVAPSAVPVKTSSAGTNGSFQHDSAIKKNEVKKTRIVAEVKPMRMTYSDVLSKNVINKNDASASNGSNNSTSPVTVQQANGGASSVQTQTKASKQSDKAKSQHQGTYDKKFNSSVNGTATEDNFGSMGGPNKSSKSAFLSSSSSSSRNEDNGTSASRDAVKNGGGTQSSSADDEYKESKSNESDAKSTAARKRNSGGTTTGGNNKNVKSKLQANGTDTTKLKRNNVNATDFETKYDENAASVSSNKSGGCFLYKICKNDLGKPGQQQSSGGRKVIGGKSTSTPLGGGSSSSATAARSNSKNEKSNSYQKRNQQRSRQKNKYDIFAKLLEKWLEYLLRFIAWLAALVYDVVVLSSGMIWERVHIGYDYAVYLYGMARKELKQNSGLPTAFCKAWWQLFDRRFPDGSKWALWRRILNKKKLPEQQAEYVRSGRLPATGDEAMFSLMNCKGKDAYRYDWVLALRLFDKFNIICILFSILGVAADCSQEQVRKHYKKIAVLVHPDKNKQAGAEEAFKILQRAFELIGEPVSLTDLYVSYDSFFFLMELCFCRKIVMRMIKVLQRH